MNLEGQVQAYADRLGRPIIVFDVDFNVIAFSVHDRDVDHARLAIILAHKGSSRARESIREYRVGHADGPVRIPPMDGGLTRHVAPVRHDGHLVGYVSSTIPEETPDEELAEDDVIRSSRDRIGVTLAAMALGNREDEDRALRLLTALLDGDAEQRTRAADELLTGGLISPVPHYTVITISAPPTVDPGSAALRLVLDRALSGIPVFPTLKAVGTVVDGEAVLVVPYEIDHERLTALLAQPAFTGLRAGVGGAHAPLAEAHRSRREARIAARGAAIDRPGDASCTGATSDSTGCCCSSRWRSSRSATSPSRCSASSTRSPVPTSPRPWRRTSTSAATRSAPPRSCTCTAARCTTGSTASAPSPTSISPTASSAANCTPPCEWRRSPGSADPIRTPHPATAGGRNQT